ncbi:GTPase domain-containing protein [Demequina rhizosphaerae]|uniref:GTPase domain-containing protein n=1 Tax=Demequina rhizosphaerae TaxID=1638985 RepID=UPI000784762F|nr:GTPase domain-containing protein [Demequina rhizosphaerae]
MSDVLFHAAPAAIRDLSDRLSTLIAEMPADRATRLSQMLAIEEHDRPRMVLTGFYSSGKSTLVKALTDEAAEVVIDSAVATDKVEVFDWDGLVDLVDTPGVQAGLVEHDAMAEEALRSADLVLFTVTVDLFDDRMIAHLKHVTEDLRKAPQLLIVITKCRTLPAAPGVRDDAVRTALGTFADYVPWVECDAKTYLDGLHEQDPSKAARRLDASRMAQVREAINQIAQERGELARFRVPLQQIALVAGEALASISDSPDEEAILAVLARQRRALTNRRGLIESALDRQAAEFRTACIRAAEELADTAESIDDSASQDRADLDAASARLNERLDEAHRAFTDSVNRVLNAQLADFTSEVREIEASPYAHQLAELDIQGDIDSTVSPVDTGLDEAPSQKRTGLPNWAPKAADHLKNFQKNWGAGDGVRQAAGSPGHKIVYGVGKHLGVKFKPYQAVRMANKIGQVAKYGSIAIPVALEAYSILQEERAETAAIKEQMRRRNAIIGGVLAQCDSIATDILTHVRGELEAGFGGAVREIDAVNQTVRDNQAYRSELNSALIAVQSEAQSMLDRLGVAALEA